MPTMPIGYKQFTMKSKNTKKKTFTPKQKTKENKIK